MAGMDNLQKLEIEMVGTWNDWRDMADACRTTIRMDRGNKPITEKYAKTLYGCEHSPIRLKWYRFKVKNIPYWIAMHFRTHKIGIEHFISTQRDDRTNVDREQSPQDALVDWEFIVNTNAIIFISRRRLCSGAHWKTRYVWKKILEVIKEDDAVLVSMCVPDCVYRGHCFEHFSCDYHHTEAFQKALKEYRSGINETPKVQK